MEPAYLFGPFVGELSWEFFRFAPYAIYLKKLRPDISLIVYTRTSRFDLYGAYANLLISLKIPNDDHLAKECFTIKSLVVDDYDSLVNNFYEKYEKKYNIRKHIYPDISAWRYRLKWQFPREHMWYDFKPRYKNKLIADQLVQSGDILIDTIMPNQKKYINVSELYKDVENKIDNYETTTLGVLIECLKNCRCIVGNLTSNISQLALLVKTPLICINNALSEDVINLLNPLKTQIIFTNTIQKGIIGYENNF